MTTRVFLSNLLNEDKIKNVTEAFLIVSLNTYLSDNNFRSTWLQVCNNAYFEVNLAIVSILNGSVDCRCRNQRDKHYCLNKKYIIDTHEIPQNRKTTD